jgi:transcriptional regulator with XRE-family HTH domain/Zn-dependent peptidase ImmA (M78 family)
MTMIKNERQYRITKAQAEKFEQALARLAEAPESDVEGNLLLRQMEEDALRSQLADLREELGEYEALQSGARSVLAIESFDEFPRALIKARIGAGISQRELADRLSLKEQQVQRYEETEYTSASIERVKEVIKALGVRVREEIFLPKEQVTSTVLFKRLSEIGFSRKFVLTRLLPHSIAARLQGGGHAEGHDSIVLQAASIIGQVLKFSPAALLGTAPLQLSVSTSSAARFNVPGGANQGRVRAYSIYAHYMALLALQATASLPQRPIPTDSSEMLRDVRANYGSLSFENVLKYIWSLGIPVLPLNDRGTFHGACFREDWRNVIVLKQQTASEARWQHLLLHEFRHTGEEPEKANREKIEAEETSKERRESKEEVLCSEFAGEVMLGGRPDELVEMCVESSNGRVSLLKNVVQRVAARERVSVGALANHIAFRLWQDEVTNWWGAAANLQEPSAKPWQTARDTFLQHADLESLSEVDRNLLQQALSAVED